MRSVALPRRANERARSTAYSSARDESAAEKDASNLLLSSYPRRRLDAESIRDTLLTLGESLDLSAPEDGCCGEAKKLPSL